MIGILTTMTTKSLIRRVDMSDQGVGGNALKLIGEVVVTPGMSQLLEGNITSGAVHAVLGLVAKSLLGVPGMLLVAANSYSTSVTGKYLHEQVMESIQSTVRSVGLSKDSATAHN